jgi:predicted phage-related endonuclease
MEIKPTFYDIDQNSEDWDALRCGKLTASMFSYLFADKKTKTYQDCITKVAFEKVTGKQQKQFSSKWMDYGHETEPEAAENYCIETFSQLQNGGIWTINNYVAASPDGKIVAENGGVEFKCPSIATYRDYLESNIKKGQVEIPKSYFWQIHGQLLCTGWHFIDYMPYYSSNVKQLLTRVYRDENVLKELTNKIEEAIIDIDNLIVTIKR